MFLSAVNLHIPICKARNVNDHPWLDYELLKLLKRKNIHRSILHQIPADSKIISDFRRLVVPLRQ